MAEYQNEAAKEMAKEYDGDQLFPGLKTYTMVPQDLEAIRSPAVIAGTDFHQMLQVSLAPGDVITTEPGSLVMMSEGLKPHVDFSCGAGCRRCCCAGENFFRLVLENKTDKPQFLALAPPRPGKLIPLPLEEWSGITLAKGAFVACYGKNWDYSIHTVGNVGTALCGGQGIFLPKLTGQGTAFISASGSVEMLTLGEGEKIIVEQLNLVAFSRTVKFDVRMVNSCLTCCCGGMGLFNAILTGPGTVIVESLPTLKLAMALRMAAAGNGQQ